MLSAIKLRVVMLGGNVLSVDLLSVTVLLVSMSSAIMLDFILLGSIVLSVALLSVTLLIVSMLSAVKLSVVMLGGIVLSVAMPTGIMSSVVLLIVGILRAMAQRYHPSQKHIKIVPTL